MSNKVKNRVGEKHITNEGYEIEIVEYKGNRNSTVRFKDGTLVYNKEYADILKGRVKNPYHKSVCGIGYYGEGVYSARDVAGNKTRVYNIWIKMLQRCYSEKSFIKHPTYKDVTVCEEWHNFQNFAQWYENNYVEGFELDKDILVKGNKMYSPKTCCFILKEINNVFKGSKQGKFTRGVNAAGNKFRASYQSKHIGSYSTPEQAFQAYKTAKEKHIKEVAEKYKNQITKEVYNALYNYQVEITD
jgi:hypothetical protein